MDKCTEIRELFDKALYGELSEDKLNEMNGHLSNCENCSQEYEELKNVITLVRENKNEEADNPFLNNFWDNIEPQLEKKESFFTSLIEKVKEILEPKQSLVYQLSGAAAILIIGIFIGKFYYGSGEVVIPQNDNDMAELRQTAINASTTNYINRSKVLLLGLMNFDPDTEEISTLNIEKQKQISTELIEQAANITHVLNDPSQRRLKKLVADLEVILLQIANLESEYDISGIEMIKAGIEKRGVFLKINIQEMSKNKNIIDKKENKTENNNKQI